jgi:hypothetical protein
MPYGLMSFLQRTATVVLDVLSVAVNGPECKAARGRWHGGSCRQQPTVDTVNT